MACHYEVSGAGYVFTAMDECTGLQDLALLFALFLSTCCFTGRLYVCGRLLFFTLFRWDPCDTPEYGSAVTSSQLWAHTGNCSGFQESELVSLVLCPSFVVRLLRKQYSPLISGVYQENCWPNWKLRCIRSWSESHSPKTRVLWSIAMGIHLEFNTHRVSVGKDFHWVLWWSINNLWLKLFY